MKMQLFVWHESLLLCTDSCLEYFYFSGP